MLPGDGENNHDQHADRIITGAVEECQGLCAVFRAGKAVSGKKEAEKREK